MNLEKREEHASARPALAKGLITGIFPWMMMQDAAQDIGAEAEAPCNADHCEKPFPCGLARGEYGKERGEDGDAVRPCDVEEAVVVDLDADGPDDGEINRCNCQADKEES